MNPKRVLIVKMGALGDVLLTTPVIRAIKNKWPETLVDFATNQAGQILLEYHPNISEIHVIEHTQSALKKGVYDLVIDLENNQVSRKASKQVNAQSVQIKGSNWNQSLLVNLKVNLLPNKHLVDRFFEALEPLGIEIDDDGLDYLIPDKYEVETDWLPETHREEYVVFAIGADYVTRQMPVEKLIETCDRINKPVMLIGGKEDHDLGEKIDSFFEKRINNEKFEKGLKELNKRTIIFNACGKFGFHQTASVIKNARAVFTHDNHWMQVAAAFQKEIFAIWGNTIPEFGSYPFLTKFTTFENTKLACRPCSADGHGSCPLGHFKCMKTQNLDFYIP